MGTLTFLQGRDRSRGPRWCEQSTYLCWVGNEADNQEEGGLKRVVDAYRVTHGV